MKNSQKGFIVPVLIIIIILIALIFGAYSYYKTQLSQEINDSDSSQNTNQQTYTNSQYGFELTFPTSWNGYSVVSDTWKGQGIDPSNSGKEYSGTLVVFKNPQTTSTQVWQDIPVMVFTPEVWKLVSEEKIAVSAAPIGPAKIGENANYIFANPPRWYGFTDATGTQEALDIVKTFKAF